MYHDSYSPRQWLLNAFQHLDRDNQGISPSHLTGDYERFMTTALSCALLLQALGRLDDPSH